MEVIEAEVDGAVERAADVLSQGHLAVVPLDGVYAVVADAFSPEAVQRLRSARGAPAGQPVTLLVRTRHQLSALTPAVAEPADRLAAAFWPGPLTLVLPAATTITVDLGESAGTVAVRLPADGRLRELIGAVGPLACSTAAPVGDPPPRVAKAAVAALGEDVAIYLDAGELDGSRSTVVDCSRGGTEVRRRGAISADDVLDAAEGAPTWADSPAPPHDPAAADDEPS